MSRLVAEFTKAFPGEPAIEARLDLPAKDFHLCVLLGPSGGGKTTVLRCLAGLERPDAGRISLNGEIWFDASARIDHGPRQRDIGFLFQEYALFPHLTVEENIGFGLAGVARAERRRRVGELLDRFGIAALSRRLPRHISGGQQQRTALARTLARRPRLLLLDEPLSALDAATREELRRELRRLLAEFAVPTVLVTHDRTEAIALADQVLVIERGRIRQQGPVEEVFGRPADVEVARIVGVETVVRGAVLSRCEGLATVRIGAVELVALAPEERADDVFVCIRGEEVVLSEAGDERTSARNRLRGVVTQTHPEGPMLRVSLDCGFAITALVTRPSGRELAIAPGRSLVASIKAPAIHLIARRPTSGEV